MSMQRCIMNALTKHRKAIEALYDAKCTISSCEQYLKGNGANGVREKVLCEEEPCRVSFDNIYNTEQTDTADNIKQVVRLFIAPELKIPDGSHIIVKKDDVTTEYRNSGEPARYASHQEIKLIPQKKRA